MTKDHLPSTPRNQRRTKSQHKAHKTNAVKARKWYGMTVSRMLPDGTMDSQVVTASTYRLHQRSIHDRRGRVIAANDEIEVPLR